MYQQVTPQDAPTRASPGEMLPRSIFYPLEVIAQGTPLVESVTGYLRRLAAVHGVPVIDLICHPHFEELFPASADRRTRRHLFLPAAYQLDGSELFGQRWVERIEAGTTQADLHCSTLWPFVDVTYSSWLRRRRAWCPHCLSKWHSAAQDLYDPLLWSIRIVSVCPIDLTPIAEICPHCTMSAPLFAGAPFPGFCGRCGGKLWVLRNPLNRLGWGDEDKYAIWCASEMLSIIGVLGEFRSPLMRTTLANLLFAKVASIGSRTLKEKIAAAGCSKRSTYLWARGAAVPRVETLFQICFHLDLRPVDLLREAAGVKTSAQADNQPRSDREICHELLQHSCLRSSATPSEQGVFPFSRIWNT